MSDGETVNTFSEAPMAVENEPCIPMQVKYVEAHTATVRQNPRSPNVPALEITEPEHVQEFQESLEQTPTHLALDKPGDIFLHSPTSSPSSESPTSSITPRFQYDPSLSYAEKVAYEMLITEKVYIENLEQIKDGFLDPVTNNPDVKVSQQDIDDLFINVKEICNFNRELLKDMEVCHYHPVKLANCFVNKKDGFDVYTKYCTHYPRSMEVLLEWTQREDTANFIKKQQETLGHTLPLCSFLLKPVQRILKYHLLLGNIAKHYKQSEDEEGYINIQKALAAMTNVAKHINDMKRIHEDNLRLQEIQSVLIEYEGPNLSSYGRLVLENTFRLHGTKTGRFLFLFEKALLITKRRSDGTFTWKATVVYSNMMLADSVFREPLTFQVIPYDDRKICYTFVSRDIDTKRVWMLELKRRLLDSYAAAVPMKAKQIILGNSEKENDEPDRNSLSTSTTGKDSDSDRKPVATVGKAGNHHRTGLPKETSTPSTKAQKPSENENRKSKDSEDMLEDKVAALMDSIKSPLRRKLRVFKKRKFSKEQSKPPKRVSWSSDDNDLLSPSEDYDYEDIKCGGAEDTISARNKPDSLLIEDSIDEEVMDIPKDEEAVSSESPSSNSPETVPEEDDSVPLGNVGDTNKDTPVKKRRMTKSRTMPSGVLLTGADERKDRSCSLTELDENGVPIGESTQVHMRENASLIRSRRMGSLVEDSAVISGEGQLRRNAGVVNLTDDGDISSIVDESSVSRTMKCVSDAFSDASFSRGESPGSSTEELTEDLTGQEDLSDVDDLGVFQQDTGYWEEHGGTLEDQRDEDCATPDLEVNNNFREVSKTPPTIWDRIEIGGDLYGGSDIVNDEGISQSGTEDETSTLLSEGNSCGDNLSDDYDDQDTSSTSGKFFDGSYQRVFAFKHSLSEENLASRCRCPPSDVPNDSFSDDNVSNSCIHTDGKRSDEARSKSVGSSPRHGWSSADHPFMFSVTPKKRIVITENLWQTIKEVPEIDSHGMASVEAVEHSVRKHKRRKKHHKSSRKGRKDEWEKEGSRVDDGEMERGKEGNGMDEEEYEVNDGENALYQLENELGYKRENGIHLEHELDKRENELYHKRGSNELDEENRELHTKLYERDNWARENDGELDEGEHTLSKGENGLDEVENALHKGENELEGHGNEWYNVENSVDRPRRHPVLRSVASIDMADYRLTDMKFVKDSDEEDNVECTNEIQDEDDDSATASTFSLSSADTLSESSAETQSVSKLSMSLQRPPPVTEQGLVQVDGNVSKVPNVTYMCVEALPSDDDVSSREDSETTVLRGNGRHGMSKVGRLSKYFSDCTTEEAEIQPAPSRSTERAQATCNIKQKMEELKRRKLDESKAAPVQDELSSLANIKDRIDVLKKTSLEVKDNPGKIKRRESLARVAQTMRHRVREIGSSSVSRETTRQVDEGLRNQLQTTLHIKDQERTDYQSKRTLSPRSRGWSRLKDRIDKLQSDSQEREADSERDITISEAHETAETIGSPRQNEELKTVVIKRGWVHQFVQKIETESTPR